MFNFEKRAERLTRLKRLMTTMSILGCSAFMVNANADLGPYSQNFEGLNPADTAALSADNWLVFGNVFDPSGTVFLYGYGVDPAPNDGGGFSGISSGEGGLDQGANQLNIFNDYNNADHANGFRIEANVFQEQTIGAADVGETYTFRFDAKRGNIELDSTATAFIKTIDPNQGFALTNLFEIDTTNLLTTWDSFEISITIDPLLPGQLLQFGFNSTATFFESSANFYDNISFGSGGIDTDGDGVDDSADNCTLVANADQRDSNGDGFGNICDPDFDNNGIVNFLDISSWVPFFNTPCGDVDQDLTGEGGCNFADYSIIPSYFNQPPGPSGIAP